MGSILESCERDWKKKGKERAKQARCAPRHPSAAQVFRPINPKAVTRNELYGYLHPQTREWKEGLVRRRGGQGGGRCMQLLHEGTRRGWA